MTDIQEGSIVKFNPFSTFREGMHGIARAEAFEGEKEVMKIFSNEVFEVRLNSMRRYAREELFVKGVDYT